MPYGAVIKRKDEVLRSQYFLLPELDAGLVREEIVSESPDMDADFIGRRHRVIKHRTGHCAQ